MPVSGKGGVDLVHVGIVETRAEHAGLEIVEPYNSRHTLQVAERALVEPEKRFEPLIPDGFFVAVP